MQDIGAKSLNAFRLVWEEGLLPKEDLFELARKMPALADRVAASNLRREYLEYITKLGDLEALGRAKRDGIFRGDDAWEVLKLHVGIWPKVVEEPETDDNGEEEEPQPKPEVIRWYLQNFTFGPEQTQVLLNEVEDAETVANMVPLMRLSDADLEYRTQTLHAFADYEMHEAHAPEIMAALDRLDPVGAKYPLLRAYNRAKREAKTRLDEDDLAKIEQSMQSMARLVAAYATRFGDQGVESMFPGFEEDWSSDPQTLLEVYRQQPQQPSR